MTNWEHIYKLIDRIAELEDQLAATEQQRDELVKLARTVRRAQWLLDNATLAEARGEWVRADELAGAILAKVRGQ